MDVRCSVSILPKMIISLPDQSVVELNCGSLQFVSLPPSTKSSSRSFKKAPFDIDPIKLADCLSNPKWKFGNCFRRISDHPRYSPKQSVHEFHISFLTSIYKFGGAYQGGTFSSSTTQWAFLDGGIISHNGYGWGSHSWTVVEGAESVRAICLFFGIIQPTKIKGELTRRPLSKLLEDMTAVSLQDHKSAMWNLPENLNM